MSQPTTPSSSLPQTVQWRGTLLASLLAMVLTGCYGAWNTWEEDRQRTLPMDIDGWGAMTKRLKEPGAGFTSLLSDPPLWKGPIVPFVFGLCYYVAPFDGAILVFNVLALALAAGCFVIGFCWFGVDRWSAVIAALLGMCYWPHHYIFGYYYAEPLLALLLSLLLLLVRWTVSSDRIAPALLTGIIGGILLLARAPFLLAVGGIPILLWLHPTATGKWTIRIGSFAVGLLLVFTPWTARNFLTYGEFIPFTTDGGKVLFQGTYLPGDSVTINEIRQIPEFAELEKKEGNNPPEQYRYWRTLAMKQIRENPLGELRLCVRKAIRFWVYLPKDSWVPSWRTTLLAAVALPLAFAGVVLGRKRVIVQLCALWVGGLWLFHALIHTELRYNYPILPLFFLLSIIGFRLLFSRLFLVSRNPQRFDSPGPASVGV